MAFREVELPSGAKLKVSPASFAESKALYQAVLDDLGSVQFSGKTEIPVLVKEIIRIAYASKRVEEALAPCMAKCVYNNGVSGDLKIDKDTFEPIQSREDYPLVCLEVAQENITPFMKSLYAVFLRVLSTIEKPQA